MSGNDTNLSHDYLLTAENLSYQERCAVVFAIVSRLFMSFYRLL